jgi:hypothetical protein
MSTEKRFVLFMVLSVLILVGAPMLMERFGLIPRPQPPVAEEEPAAKPEAIAGKEKARADASKAKGQKPALVATKDDETDQPRPKDEVKPKDEARTPDVPLVGSGKLVLGSLADKTGQGYRFRVDFDQKGAGVLALASALHEAEIVEGLPRNRPLELIQPEMAAPPSFALNLASLGGPNDPDGSIRLDDRHWEVVVDAQGRFVRPLIEDKVDVGQELVFRTKDGSPA